MRKAPGSGAALKCVRFWRSEVTMNVMREYQCAAANPAGASRLQSSRPVRRVAELGSFGRTRHHTATATQMMKTKIMALQLVGIAVIAFVGGCQKTPSNSVVLSQLQLIGA